MCPAHLEDAPVDTAEEITLETARIRQELEEEMLQKGSRQGPPRGKMVNSAIMSMSTPNLHLNDNHANPASQVRLRQIPSKLMAS